jgi:2-amino-1-hydroxyethylphosphonate dioxygenase (glycine-forming)
MCNETPVATADEIIGLFEKYGRADYIGEPVSQIEHMCQCAQLAMAAGADDDLVLAAFLHDIGHLYGLAFPEKELAFMDDCGVVDHEQSGAAYLRSKGFSPALAAMVQGHVAAKRYLVAKSPDYQNGLSEASKQTLVFQGGLMDEAEMQAFEEDPLFDSYVALRHWDDQAKLPEQPLPDLLPFRQLIIAHLTQQTLLIV